MTLKLLETVCASLQLNGAEVDNILQGIKFLEKLPLLIKQEIFS